MAHYLIQVSYSQGSVKALVEHPQDRSEVVRKTVESAGGKLNNLFFSFGEYDVALLAEFPTNQAAAAMALAVGATGSVSRYQTTVLFTPQEAVEAMNQSKKIAYTPPR
jgi:uncharacterized protein with GYD domain